ncbi:MAG: SDR family oxidoreductase [Novosphingobium sp.]|nr:SDR family oxidoreductase [Novosphingobium sp.]
MSEKDERKVAMITGASRGIGKAIAIELAEAGYDVAVTARTVHEGEGREHSSTIKKSDTSPLPGSLDSTVAEIEKVGGRAMSVAADLLEAGTLGAATAQVIERWGRIDVMVHNGRYIGPGHMDLFLDTPIDILRKHLEANCIGPLVMNQIAVPQMLKQGGGTLIHITSGASYGTPTLPAGKGGHGMGYGISKAAFHRTASFFNTELGDQGIRAFNVQPGFIATERMAQDMKEFGFGNDGAPPQVVGRVVRWLCTAPEADDWLGTTIEAQYFCHKQGLLPGWEGPYVPKTLNTRFDLSGYELKVMMEELMESAEAG